MTGALEAILEPFIGLPEAEREAMYQEALAITGDVVWHPNPGPQTEAYYSPADLLLFGGAGGGGKTDILTGLALTQHSRSLLLRPQYTDLGALIDRVVEVAGTRRGLNQQPPAQFKWKDRLIDFGAALTLEKAQTWQGNPHDLIGFDEACLFLEDSVRFLMGWNRAADSLGVESKQRRRIVMASNPPLRAGGEWIIGMFRPWLDVAYANPAEPGEIRYFITDPDGKDMEVEGPDDFREFEGKKYEPKSRTFIPAKLGDNPFLKDTGYQATLDAMPEPMRSAIRDGNFLAAREDDSWQVIPTAWILAANERWRQGKPVDEAMSSIGLDVARGGRDSTVFSPRYGVYFGEQTIVPGRDTPDGPSVAVLVAGMLREGAVIGIDNIGIGADAETSLKNAGLPFEALNGSAKSSGMTRDGAFGFATYRSEMWWSLREALDPEYGFELALPPDQALQADLASPTYEVRPGEPPKIYIEGKRDSIKRLGRSPDRGDSVVYAWNSGGLSVGGGRRRRGSIMGTPKPDTSYDELRYR